MPCFRHSSPVLAPASASFRTPMICSSCVPLPNHEPSFHVPFYRRILFATATVLGGKVNPSRGFGLNGINWYIIPKGSYQ